MSLCSSISFTEADKVDSAAVAFFKSGILTTRQKQEWDDKPAADKTWPNVKTYFTDAYRTQSAYGDVTALGAGYHSANGPVQESREEREEQRQAETERDNTMQMMFGSPRYYKHRKNK